MAMPEWGTKRQCPKCAERFYDLKKAFPLTCVACGYEFEPEALLKSKAPLQEDPAKLRKVVPEASEAAEVGEEEFEDEFEAEGDDDTILADELEDEEDVADVIDKRPSKEEI
ncbi:TIGR02300 family protein [Govanella unica]|uniref:TIGR02300 family protein n=1 Tax=Govanella unica TaxID=2975056 RepID=A0A9X3TZD5_9PROT|nr:TIGR02300 family protein [Govania unica]MDA5194591.1 TIGR02300 family protein [Govania unica]